MGRKAKKLTRRDLSEVEALAGLGLTQEQIGSVKGMCDDTLRKYAKDAFHRGRAKAIARVAQTAYEMAVSSQHPAMTMFYLKTQARWRERHDELPPELRHLLAQESSYQATDGDKRQ
jgi:transcriptional regulator with XRE-family HTH domain